MSELRIHICLTDVNVVVPVGSWRCIFRMLSLMCWILRYLSHMCGVSLLLLRIVDWSSPIHLQYSLLVSVLVVKPILHWHHSCTRLVNIHGYWLNNEEIYLLNQYIPWIFHHSLSFCTSLHWYWHLVYRRVKRSNVWYLDSFYSCVVLIICGSGGFFDIRYHL